MSGTGAPALIGQTPLAAAPVGGGGQEVKIGQSWRTGTDQPTPMPTSVEALLFQV